jgi:hypothetical protein
MNVKLLRQVKKLILEEPKRLRMARWYSLHSHGRPACNTVACIGGWITILANRRGSETTSDTAKRLHESYLDVTESAGEILGVRRDDACALFHESNWPDKLHLGYKTAKTPAARARIAAKAIDRFIRAHK